MEIGSDGLMNSMFMTRIYDNIWTGEEEIRFNTRMWNRCFQFPLSMNYCKQVLYFLLADNVSFVEKRVA